MSRDLRRKRRSEASASDTRGRAGPEFDRPHAPRHNYQTVVSSRTRRARLVAGALGALTLGCGLINCSKPPSATQDPFALPADSKATAPAPIGAHAPPAAPVLPVFDDEILAARVSAQRQILSRGNLFEDLDGKPVQIAASDQPRDSSVEDDILDSLPGSAGQLNEIGEGEGPVSRANGNALGLFVPIEEPADAPALAHFYQALRLVRSGGTKKVRILAYGASHTQGDVYTGYLRSYLQTRFGDGGHGYISLAKTNKWYRHLDMTVESRGWIIEHAQKRHARLDGYFGLLGASASSADKRHFGRVRPRGATERAAASHYEIAYLAQPDGGAFKLYVDGKMTGTISTSATQPGAGYHVFDLDFGPHEIEVRPAGKGEVRLFGLVAEADTPGVVLDTLGISGTRAANMLKWDEELWADAVRRRAPDLYMLAYGTNESNDLHQSIERYRADLAAVLERFQRAAPEASCLIVGPGDVPRRIEEDVWAPRPRLHQILEIQRELAFEMGCGFWDTRAFMGGVNSMHRWSTSAPQMASKDRIHLTRRGYVRMGMALADAMMVGFDAT